LIREWYTDVIIKGKKYRVYHEEWSGYGGSTHRTSRMVLIENESQKVNKENIAKAKGEKSGQEE
jgi:hypothetical protein